MPIALMASRCPLGIALIERHEMAEQMGTGYAGEGAEGCWGAKVRVVGGRQKGSGWADGYRGQGWSRGGGGGGCYSVYECRPQLWELSLDFGNFTASKSFLCMATTPIFG